jgi:malate dehydrogenase (oxaloacetate-decarboxylating)
MDYNKKSVEMHKKYKGKIEISSRVPIYSKEDLSIAYSPGVAGPCLEIAKDEKKYRDLVSAGRTVAVISDGSSVLGLGNIGAKAAMPVMEGKALLFKKFAGLNAFPIVLATQDTEEIITTIKNISPSFAGINLEDISAPRCFEIEERLKQMLNIPVFHDDQHGTAIVALAGVINYLKISAKTKENVSIVINGSGAAGTAIAKLFNFYGFSNIVICDSKGIISSSRVDLNQSKKDLLKFVNKNNISGSVFDALKNADIFIGVSKGNLIGKKEVKSMAKNPAIFAMANPIPEIMPDEAKKAGALVVATGRSDFDNQINNVLVFPGIFKGAFEFNITKITDELKICVAVALAGMVKNPTPEKIIPSPFDSGVADFVSKAVGSCKSKI